MRNRACWNASIKMAGRILATVACLTLLAGWAGAAEYYVMPGSGSDDNPGRKAQPFKTLGKACAAALAGDTVYLGGGTYREILKPKNSGEAGKPIRFVALPGGKVELSGAEALTGTWEKHSGSIYKLATSRKFIQLFVDGKMMPEARWPNIPLNDLMARQRATAGKGTGYESLADANLPPGDWNGAIVTIWPGSEWGNGTRRVTGYQPGKSFRFDRTMEQKVKDSYHAQDPYQPRQGNPYLLSGSLAGLDSPGEWFLDERTGTVYLWTPDGAAPGTHRVEVKARDYACDLSGLGFIEVQGIDIFGAAVDMSRAHDCLLDDCRLRYVSHLRECDSQKLPPPINRVSGKNNEWRKCLVAYAATEGVSVTGEGNALVNCVIHDVDYLGTMRGGLDLGGSVGARVSHCTVFRTGRDAIFHSGSKRILIEYCDVYHANLLNNDAGAIYCWGGGSQDGVIAHNWVHDNPHANGIYLDNFSSHFSVHHNLIWNCGGDAFHVNSDALNHLIANNTALDVRAAFGTFAYSGHPPTMKGTRILNNLLLCPFNPTNPAELVPGALGPECSHNGQGTLDDNGCPVAGSAAIDAGMIIEGMTDGYRGKAPDLGAYELGGEQWTAGANWRDPEAAPLPAKSLKVALCGPITEKTMIQNGLALWLDANDRSTLDLASDGSVLAWRDKSPGKRVAKPVNTSGSLKLVPGGLAGKPVVRGGGRNSLRITGLEREAGPLMVFMVSQALEAAGPTWQRLIACHTGAGQEWESPNWMIGRAGGAKPQAYPAQLFTYVNRTGGALGKITVLGASAADGQNLAGDVAEVLVFERSLKFDEYNAVVAYLKGKWGLSQK